MSSILTKQTNTKQLWFFYLLIIGLVLSRLIPHPANFTPIGAIGVFVGAYSLHRWQWLVPVIGLLISDYLIGFYDLTSMLFVYLGLIASCGLGKMFLANNIRWSTVIGTGFASAVIFFVLSNFGVWLSGQMYPLSFAGLTQCYIAAIPFFGNTLASNLLFMFLAFGIYELVINKTKLEQRNSFQ